MNKSELIGSIRVHLKMNYYNNDSFNLNIIELKEEDFQTFSEFLEDEIPNDNENIKKAYSKLYKTPVCYVNEMDKIIYRNALKDLMNELGLLK